jgi:hypothetical protein
MAWFRLSAMARRLLEVERKAIPLGAKKAAPVPTPFTSPPMPACPARVLTLA